MVVYSSIGEKKGELRVLWKSIIALIIGLRIR